VPSSKPAARNWRSSSKKKAMPISSGKLHEHDARSHTG
jgi:hypothetical protein